MQGIRKVQGNGHGWTDGCDLLNKVLCGSLSRSCPLCRAHQAPHPLVGGPTARYHLVAVCSMQCVVCSVCVYVVCSMQCVICIEHNLKVYDAVVCGCRMKCDLCPVCTILFQTACVVCWNCEHEWTSEILGNSISFIFNAVTTKIIIIILLHKTYAS